MEPSSPATVPSNRHRWFWLIGLVALIPVGLILIRAIAIWNANKLIEGVRARSNARVHELMGASIHRPPYYEPAEEGDAWAAHMAAIDTVLDSLSPEELERLKALGGEEEEPDGSKEEELTGKLVLHFGQVRRGLKMTWVRPSTDWNRGFEGLPPVQRQLDYFKALARVARDYRLKGREEASLELLTAGLAIAQDLSTNGALITDLIREVNQEKLRAEIRDLLRGHGLSASALREVLRMLEAVEQQRAGIASVMARDLLCGRVSMLHSMDDISDQGWGLNPMPRYFFSNRVILADALKRYEEIEGDVRKLSELPPIVQAKDNSALLSRTESPNILVGLLMPTFARAWTGWIGQQTNANLVRCAAALACYEAEKGRYPDSLSELSPSYLRSVPSDLYAEGAPLIYMKDATSVTVYSVGQNHKDDGGRAFDENEGGDPREGDLVWTVKRK